MAYKTLALIMIFTYMVPFPCFLKLIFKRRLGSWEDDLGSKAPGLQAQRPEFNPRTHIKMPGLMLHTYTVSTGDTKTGGSLGLTWLLV